MRKFTIPLFLLAVIVLAAARDSANPAVPPVNDSVTTFKSTSRLVQLDIVVTDLHGKFADGLTKNDFTILEDRTEQPIKAFEAPGEHPKNPYSNTEAPVTIFVLDELNSDFHDMAYARNQFAHYLQSQPAQLEQPSSLVVIDNIEFKVLHTYTQNRDELLQVLKKHMPRYPTKMEKGVGIDRLAATLDALRQVASSTIGLPIRKNVIWVGAGYPAMNLIGLHEDQKKVMADDVSRTINKLLEARITVYPIDPTIMTSLKKGILIDTDDPDTALNPNQTPAHLDAPDKLDMDLNITALGPATGGKAYYWRNDIDSMIQTTVDDGMKYYTVAYVPTNRTEIPKYRRIKVKVRPGLVARTREGYYSTDVPLTKGMVASDLAQAAQNTLPYSGLPVTLTGRAKDGKAVLTIYVNAQSLTWQSMANGDGRGQVSIAVASFSAQDKMLYYEAREMTSILPAPQFKFLPRRATTFHMEAKLPHHAERLRLIVRDNSTGHIGTVDMDANHLPSQAELPKPLAE